MNETMIVMTVREGFLQACIIRTQGAGRHQVSEEPAEEPPLGRF